MTYTREGLGEGEMVDKMAAFHRGNVKIFEILERGVLAIFKN